MQKLAYFSAIWSFAFCLIATCLLLSACGSNNAPETAATKAPATAPAPDTLNYPYKASYSSDFTVPSNPGNALKVLKVWKMFETADIQAMKPYYADTVTYEDASGMRFHGPTEKLLAFAKQDIAGLDSMRFDISAWQSSHSNDKNEDWVSIWSAERRYPKNGRPDTVLMQENWKVKDGLVVYFNI
jgi:SnoaL-like domain